MYVCCVPPSKFKIFSGIEDKENWHGKAIPKDEVEAVINSIQALITNEKKLAPGQPTEDAPPVCLQNIKLSAPPAYKHLEKVNNHTHQYYSPWAESLSNMVWEFEDAVGFSGSFLNTEVDGRGR